MEESSSEFSSVDEALAEVGGYRRWNILIFVLLSFSSFCGTACNGLSVLFIGWIPPHECNDWKTLTAGNSNDQCYSNESDAIKCSNWTYNAEGYTTIATEWDLVCTKKLLPDLAQAVFHLGGLLGDIFGLCLVDLYGRKRMHILGSIAVAVSGSVVAWMPVYSAFISMRIVEGFFVTLVTISGLTLQMELFDSKRREFPGIGCNLGWMGAYFLLVILGYYIQAWRILQTVISVLGLLWVSYCWLTPESPIWLAANGKYAESEKALQTIADLNGVNISVTLVKDNFDCLLVQAENHTTISENSPTKEAMDCSDKAEKVFLQDQNAKHIPSVTVLDQKQMEDCAEDDAKIVHLITHPVLRLHTAMSMFLWLTNMMIYYFLALSVVTLAGDRFLNIFLGGLLELPGYMLAYILVSRIGRRLTLIIGHLLAGILMIIILIITRLPEMAVAVNVLTLCTRCVIAMSFGVIIPYTKELVPTNLRGTSSGLFNIFGRCSAILVPFGAFMMKTSFYWVPYLVSGVMSVSLGLLLFLLPETTDKPLPQKAEDVYALYDDSQYTGLLKIVQCHVFRRRIVKNNVALNAETVANVDM